MPQPRFSLHPFFDDSGNNSLIIITNCFPISSPVLRYCSSRPLNSSWSHRVSLCLTSAMSGTILIHLTSMLFLCRLSESVRARKSPQRSLKWICKGWASMVSQCCFKSSQVPNPARGHRRHLGSLIVWLSQPAFVAKSSALYLSFNRLGSRSAHPSSAPHCRPLLRRPPPPAPSLSHPCGAASPLPALPPRSKTAPPT
ncbi:hypothetical protein B0F90DRAFT_1211762 [Multifurca ochricompacta]|uniref:Uncharacterized protein n=1 Tax=Multifurca ochricompacta TaxID=376703 RepID=A0AAD4QKU1_9AGAM|nr:hypothetical protein B0F90DRAFT_1211762 [Multifurca ochricompacta]